MPCLIKRSIGISCPTCGLTRGFLAIFDLDFYSALKYNILSVPFLLFFVISFIWLLIDVIRDKSTFFTKMNKILSDKKVLIILFAVIIIATVLNNYKNI